MSTISEIARSLIDLDQIKIDSLVNDQYSKYSVIKLNSSVNSKRILDELININVNGDDEFEKNISQKYTDILQNSYFSDTLTRLTSEARSAQELIDSIRGIPWNKRNLNIKRRIDSIAKLNDDYDPLYDERNYTRFDQSLDNTYTLATIQSLKSKTNRTRISTLLPNSGLTPHKDLPIRLGGRIHIPLKTNNYNLYFSQSKNGKIHVVNMEENSVYFVNTGLTHWFHNFGNEPRIHMILCCSVFLDTGEILC